VTEIAIVIVDAVQEAVRHVVVTEAVREAERGDVGILI